MKRYVSVKGRAGGSALVSVALVDGELSARWEVKTYIGDVDNATKVADRYAHEALEQIRVGLEPTLQQERSA